MNRLLGDLWLVSGKDLTHAWDANAYLIGGEEPTLIDCGSSAGYPALRRALQRLGYEPRDVRRVIATHGHWDHLSAMALLREESDAKLYLHEADRNQVESGDYERTAAYLYGEPFPAAQVDEPLCDGDILHVNGLSVSVYHTPGHSPGSVCFLTEAEGVKVLIVGDTLWGGFHPRLGSDIDAWMQSLDRLLELDFDVITAGHCPPRLIPNGKWKVGKAREMFGMLFDPWFKFEDY